MYGDLQKEELRHLRGIQQTSTGTYIENFYILRVKPVVNKDLQYSPYIDQQIYLCHHELPEVDFDES
jgi:hypothetical protein